jgi:eukaryotic-like serine/threonine-protein kinase
MKLMRDLVGETLSNRYLLVARVAGGGMGEVYRAQDLLLDRSVAVKVLQPSLASEPDLIARFKAEARAAARLAHPNIVTVHDWGCEDDQTYFMVMEYVAGTDLRDLLTTRGALQPAQAVDVVASMCDALTAAHRAGLIHRDVKPENVMIARDGTVKVTDFGIAVVAGSEITIPGGTIPGTLRYLSPEQARGEDATYLSDIWAAGAVLCELLTGRPPVDGSHSDVLRRRAVESPTPPSQIAAGLPTELDPIVLKACALQPGDRYFDGAEMAADLRSVASHTIPAAPSVATLVGDVTGEIVLPGMEPTTYTRRPRGRRKGMGLRLAIVFGIVALLALGGFKLVSALVAPKDVPVPVVEGVPVARADDIAEDVGLNVKVVGRRKDEDVAKGRIISQVPADGVIKEGEAIKVVVSTGPPKFAVPTVVGLPLDKAKDVLLKKHMKVGAVTQEYSMEPTGTVISQEPADGRFIADTPIDLTVSQGPPLVGVPDVIDEKAGTAKRLLEKAGFEVAIDTEYSDEILEGHVISTNPPAASSAPQGSQILLVVSKGPEFETMRMPDVRGMSIDAATQKLEGMGLRVRVVQSCGGGGTTVIDTDPLDGQPVRENDLVDLYTC